MYVCMYECIVCMNVKYECMHVYIYIYVNTYICIYVYMYICIYVYMSYGQNLVHGEGTSLSRVGPYRFCSGGTLYKPS